MCPATSSGEKHSLNSRWKSSLRTTLNLDSCYLVLQVNFCLIWLNLADLAFDQGNVVHVHLRSKQMTINMGSSWCFINVFNRRAKVKFFIRKSFLLMVKPSRQNCTHSWSIWSNPCSCLLTDFWYATTCPFVRILLPEIMKPEPNTCCCLFICHGML